jgi:hypothetical protein
MNIEIDGKTYELNVTLATKTGALKPAYTPKKVGDHFRSPCNNEIYVLTAITEASTCAFSQVSLVNIKNGRRVGTTSTVAYSSGQLNKQEWKDVCGDPYYYIPVTLGTINSTDK